MAKQKTESIITKSNKTGREVSTEKPRVLHSDVTLQELVDALGEDMTRQKVQAQLTVDFRGQTRGRLENFDDNGDPKFSDEEIANESYYDWVPETKTRKSKTEKVADQVAVMSEEEKAKLRELLNS